MNIRQAITFDDVLLQPGASEVTPSEVDFFMSVLGRLNILMAMIIKNTAKIFLSA